jgi:hypothetical protein
MNDAKKKRKHPLPPPAPDDDGFGESHGYGPSHGGPSGPGDVPADETAAGPAKAPPPSGDEDDVEPT